MRIPRYPLSTACARRDARAHDSVWCPPLAGMTKRPGRPRARGSDRNAQSGLGPREPVLTACHAV